MAEMYKQIAILITLGLVLTVGVLAAVYPQHAFAHDSGGNGGIGGGGIGGGTSGPPGLATACVNPNVEQHNRNC